MHAKPLAVILTAGGTKDRRGRGASFPPKDGMCCPLPTLSAIQK